MQTWLNSHGHTQHDILKRLSKDAVRNHHNVRASGDNAGLSHVGGSGHNAGVEAQSNLQGYLHNIPGVHQASSMMGNLGLGGKPERAREPSSALYPAGEVHHPPSPSRYAPPPVTSGEAAGFYGSGSGPSEGVMALFPSNGILSSPAHQHHRHSAPHDHVHHDVSSYPTRTPAAFPLSNPSFPSETAYEDAQPPFFPSPVPNYAPPEGPPPDFPSASPFPVGSQYSEQPRYEPPRGRPPPNQTQNQYNYGSGPRNTGG